MEATLTSLLPSCAYCSAPRETAQPANLVKNLLLPKKSLLRTGEGPSLKRKLGTMDELTEVTSSSYQNTEG